MRYRRYSQEKLETAERMFLAGSTTTQVVWETKLSNDQADAIARRLIAEGKLSPRKKKSSRLNPIGDSKKADPRGAQ